MYKYHNKTFGLCDAATGYVINLFVYFVHRMTLVLIHKAGRPRKYLVLSLSHLEQVIICLLTDSIHLTSLPVTPLPPHHPFTSPPPPPPPPPASSFSSHYLSHTSSSTLPLRPSLTTMPPTSPKSLLRSTRKDTQAFLSAFPHPVFLAGSTLALATYRKTQICSHLNFLLYCLRKRTPPMGSLSKFLPSITFKSSTLGLNLLIRSFTSIFVLNVLCFCFCFLFFVC